VPLALRKRPHLVAGGIRVFEGRGPTGKIIQYYCPVSASGRPSATLNQKVLKWLGLVP
jgi:hypothetical protein